LVRRILGRADADPDLVQDGVITHGFMIASRQVNRHHTNPVIVASSGAAG